jgi:hypothetical protein
MAASFHSDAGGLWTEQASGAALDYSLDWSADLDGSDEIAESVWVADPGLIVDRRSLTETTTTAWLSGGVGGQSYRVKNTITTATGRVDSRSFRVFVRDEAAVGAGLTSVFGSLPAAIATLRRDRLVAPSQSYMAGQAFSDEYILGKLLAAEAYAERRLRVFLTPVEMLPSGATDAEKAALDAAGQRWEQEPGYDFNPTNRGAWGWVDLRQAPVIAVHSLRFAYPSPTSVVFEVPRDWIRLDAKYGKLQLVPTQSAVGFSYSGLMLSQIGTGRGVPQAIQVRYRAGLESLPRKAADLLSLLSRIAVLDILDDQFMGASGSTSIDGISQSVTWDSGKHRAGIDEKLDTIRDSLQGIRLF